jgi:hypothetical protein
MRLPFCVIDLKKMTFATPRVLIGYWGSLQFAIASRCGCGRAPRRRIGRRIAIPVMAARAAGALSSLAAAAVCWCALVTAGRPELLPRREQLVSCIEGNYSCSGQCFSNGSQLIQVSEYLNRLRAYTTAEGNATPFFCNTIDGGDEEECGAVVPGTGGPNQPPVRLSFTTVADHRAGSPPFIEDFYFDAPDCASFTKLVRAPGATHMLCQISCRKQTALLPNQNGESEAGPPPPPPPPPVAPRCGGSFASSGASTRVLFSNERMRVLDWRLPAGAAANVSSSRAPTVAWQVVGAREHIPVPQFRANGSCTVVCTLLFRQPAANLWSHHWLRIGSFAACGLTFGVCAERIHTCYIHTETWRTRSQSNPCGAARVLV